MDKFLGLLHRCVTFLHNVIREKLFIYFVCIDFTLHADIYGVPMARAIFKLEHIVQDVWDNPRTNAIVIKCKLASKLA